MTGYYENIFKFIIIGLALFPILGYSQSTSCIAENGEHYSSFIQEIIDESDSPIQFSASKSKELHPFNKLGQKSTYLIDSIDRYISANQIETLLTCDNVAIKAVAFNLFYKRSTKDQVISKFLEVLSEPASYVVTGAYDAFNTTTYQEFCFEVISDDQKQPKPQFPLTNKELDMLDRALRTYKSVRAPF